MNSQFKKGVLDLCVLAFLSKGDSYGYNLAECLANKIAVADGTVYPILRKLASEGYVDTYLKESQNGPPRKYYHLTDLGKGKLNADKADWDEFSKAVNEVLSSDMEVSGDE
ncbi:MAG: PadR family transcriptional regulator [Saccharofermentans sp.]|nr:PadR family transcriptional regulator [Saccharofermentans sp.]